MSKRTRKRTKRQKLKHPIPIVNCYACSQQVNLRKDGTITEHGEDNPNSSKICHGSFKTPKISTCPICKQEILTSPDGNLIRHSRASWVSQICHGSFNPPTWKENVKTMDIKQNNWI